MLVPIPVLQDNYVWLYQRENCPAVLVDMGDFEAVDNYLQTNKISLEALLITHPHHDHIGGVEAFKQKYPHVPIYSLKPIAEQFNTTNYKVKVIASHGHSSQDLCYIIDGHLFCGDVLFSAGCGRVFTGDYASMFEVLQKINQLPPETKICPAHEYTLSNLKFALATTKDNALKEVISANMGIAQFLRKDNLPTLPSTLAVEKQINLFLRAKTLEEFKQLRTHKDNF